MTPEFKPYGKTPRLGALNCVITEKIDGTNALVCISENGVLCAGSRNRWLIPERISKGGDNFGFAQWVSENETELRKLGVGYHYGEWWGRGIGRGYGLDTRHFSLFNTRRFGNHNPNTPQCCSVVPVLYKEEFDMDCIDLTVSQLQQCGSRAAPGFMRPEGVIVYMPTFDQRFKIVFDKHGPSPIESV